MAFSTFSGPIRSGTVRYGTVAAGNNVGVVVLAQTATVAFGAVTTSPTAQRLFVVPAGSKIIQFNIERVVTFSGGSISAIATTFGNAAILGNAGQTLTAASANSLMTSVSDSTLTTGMVTRASIDAAMVTPLANNIGTYDMPITGTFTAGTGNPTAGSLVVTVMYMQRLASGSTGPTSYTT
jgi:hypothetical protein